MQQGSRAEATPAPTAARERLEMLHMNRAELRSQLSTVNQLRSTLVGQLVQSEGTVARLSVQKRINELDDRIARLQTQILAADDAIASGMVQGVAAPALLPPAPPVPPVQDGTIGVPDHVFHDVMGSVGDNIAAATTAVIVSFVVVSVFFYRLARRRTTKFFEALSADQARRFEQLQQAIDVVAVETERISEAQRFVSRKVNELGAGEAQPIGMQRSMADPLRRDER